MSTHRPDYTAEQQAAISTRHVSVALSAGAGTGKTFVLTQRFLSHLEPGSGIELSELVAITFTDRAAREMRDRIRSACRSRLHTCPKSEVEHWLGVLYGLDTARIATIHSFCTSLLRRHAVEAGLDPRFTVGDAAQTEALLQQSARDTLHRLLEQEVDAAMTLVMYFGLERSRNILSNLIGQRFNCIPSQLAAITKSECENRWLASWNEECVPQLLQEFRESWILDAVRKFLGEHAPNQKSVMWNRCCVVQELLKQKPTDVKQPLAWLEELREAAKVQGGGGKSAWSHPEEHDEIQGLFKQLREQIDKCLKQVTVAFEDVPQAAELTELFSQLASVAITDYEALKQKLAWLDFDDLLLKARDLLRSSPDVSRKLAAGIKLLMVDEFQDTDPVQAEIVEQLAGAALTTGKLFLVGDPKQSIYRFRRADPEVFAKLSARIPEEGTLKLSENFRSVPDVLHFVNRVFAKPLGRDFQELRTSPQYQVSEAERAEIAPVIEFLWATQDVVPTQTAAEDKPKADELRRREADWIALRIAELLADERPLIRQKQPAGPPKLRRVMQGDIVVLFRTLSDVPAYEAALLQRGIEYYLVGGKTFYAQQEVFDLWNLCQWLDEPADEIPLVGLLRSPFFNLSDDAIHALKLSGPTITEAFSQPPPDWLDAAEQNRIRFAGQALAELRHLKDRLPPSELLQTAIDRTGYDAALLLEHLGSRKVANLTKLVHQAKEFDDAELFTLKDYVRQLERSVLEQTEESLAVTLPEAGDVVRLMTIHQSKGLEFPVVFVADMNRRGNFRTSGTILHEKWGAMIGLPEDFGHKPEHLGLRIHRLEEEPKDQAESARLLYVAMTRAADRLILSAGMTPELKLESHWISLLAESFKLNTGQPNHDAIFGSMTGHKANRRTIPEILVHRSPPKVEIPKEKSERLTSVGQLVEMVTASEPEDFPETARVFSPTTDWIGMLSVSLLEAATASSPRPIHKSIEEHFEDRVSGAAADVVGTVVHRVLQQIDFQQPETWPDLLEITLAQECSTPDEQQAVGQQARVIIGRLMNSSAREPLAQAKQLFREIDFVLHWPLEGKSPRAIFTGQIDVLWQSEAGTWSLFDYKTGVFPESVSDEELLAPYSLQLGLYALAAERYLGTSLATISLVVMRPVVRLLELKWTKQTRQAICQRIEEQIAHARANL